MSTAKQRASQTPPRNPGPFSMHPNGYNQVSDAYSTSPNAGWNEPPLRQPDPTFQDHPGASRQGVVENMLPLGTPPTARVKARAKGEPLRKVIQARSLGGSGMVVDESRGTPEALLTTGGTRAGSLRADEQSGRASPAIDPALMDFDIPEVLYSPNEEEGEPSQPPPFAQMLQHHQAEQMPEAEMQQSPRPPPQMEDPMQASPGAQMRQQAPAQTAQMQNFPATPAQSVAQQSPSLLATPSTNATGAYTPSPIPSDSPFFSAVSIANRNQTPEVHQPLAFLYSATQQDEELVRLLQDAVRDSSIQDPVYDKASELARKIKRVKKNFRAQTMARAPLANSGADAGRQASNASVSPAKQNQTTIGSPVNDGKTHQKPRADLTSTPQRSSPLRTSTRLSRSSASRRMGSLRGGAASNPSALARRASSSPLSSVDENVAASAPPLATSDARQVSLKRTLAEAGSVLTAKDEEMEVKRKRLKQDFDDVEVSESNVRRPPAEATSQHAVASKPAPQLKFWPPGVHNDLVGANGGGPATPTALGRPPSKKKDTPRTKTSPNKNARKPAVAGVSRPDRRRRASTGHDDNKSEASDNNDYCSACNGPGYLLCCDGCDRAFHFNCLDPPLEQDGQFDSSWFCSECEASRDTVKRPQQGLFADLHFLLEQNNPRSFSLPDYIKSYFHGQRTGYDGEYVADPDKRPVPGGRNQQSYEEDFRKLNDAKGNSILCSACGKSSFGGRDIVACDYCPLSWHLDCLDPPLANPPYRSGVDGKRPAWMCPLHAEHDLKEILPIARTAQQPLFATKAHRHRRVAKAVVVPTHMRRGFRNNGLIEVGSDSDSDSGFESEEMTDGIFYKVPRQGIKLDFIDKVKIRRLALERDTREHAAQLKLSNELLKQDAAGKLAHDISIRRHEERKAAFNLAQFSQRNPDLKLGDNELDNLIYTLEAEAAPEVTASLAHDEFAVDRPRSLLSPSPSTSVLDAKTPSTRQRDILERMRDHIQRILDAGVNGA